MKPPYEITKKILELYGQIQEALGICQSILLVKPEAKLRKQNRIKTIHSSLAIEGNTLNPDQVLTRDEMALIAYNVVEILKIKLPKLQSAVEFDDEDAINPNAKDAVAALSKAGIILGNGDGTFAPKGTTIRAAAAKVVHMTLVLK